MISFQGAIGAGVEFWCNKTVEIWIRHYNYTGLDKRAVKCMIAGLVASFCRVLCCEDPRLAYSTVALFPPAIVARDVGGCLAAPTSEPVVPPFEKIRAAGDGFRGRPYRAGYCASYGEKVPSVLA